MTHWEETVITRLWMGENKTEMTETTKLLRIQAERSYKAGQREALTMYAWWQDGTQYVGTTGTTLNEALKERGIE